VGQLVVVPAMKTGLAGKRLLQLAEELFVTALARAENHEAGVGGLQEVGQDVEAEVEPLLVGQTGHDAHERRALASGESELLEQVQLVPSLAVQVVGAEGKGDQRVPVGAPLAVVHPVENPDDRAAPRTEDVLESHAVFVALDLAGVGRTHRRDGIRVDQSRAEEVDPTGSQVPLVEEMPPRAEAEPVDRRGVEIPLVPDVVDREQDPGRPEQLVPFVDRAQQERDEGRVPVVAVEHVRSPAEPLATFDHGTRKEREALGLVGFQRVERAAVKELRAVDQDDFEIGSGQPGRPRRENVGVGAEVDSHVPGGWERVQVEVAPVDRGVERYEQAHVVAAFPQPCRKRRGDIGKPARLGERDGF